VCAVGDVCGIGGIRCLVPTISQSALNKRQNSIGTRHFDVPLLLNYAIAVPPLFSFYWFPRWPLRFFNKFSSYFSK
jgi:hypothetical protein